MTFIWCACRQNMPQTTIWLDVVYCRHTFTWNTLKPCPRLLRANYFRYFCIQIYITHPTLGGHLTNLTIQQMLWQYGHHRLTLVVLNLFYEAFTYGRKFLLVQGPPYLISPLCRIYASVNWVIIGSGNGLSHVRRQVITWTNTDVFQFQFSIKKTFVVIMYT